MIATVPGAFGAAASIPVDRAAAYITSHTFERPTLIIDLARVGAQYDALAEGLGRARIHYAVKANPHPDVLALLVAKGSCFDAASRGEIELYLAQGATGPGPEGVFPMIAAVVGVGAGAAIGEPFFPHA